MVQELEIATPIQFFLQLTFFQTETEAEFNGLINADTEIVSSVAGVSGVTQENKINNDDIDLALDALRNCDTDFMKFDDV